MSDDKSKLLTDEEWEDHLACPDSAGSTQALRADRNDLIAMVDALRAENAALRGLLRECEEELTLIGHTLHPGAGEDENINKCLLCRVHRAALGQSP